MLYDRANEAGGAPYPYTPPGAAPTPGPVPPSAGFGGFDPNGGWNGGGVSDPIPTASAPSPPPADTPNQQITLSAGFTPDYDALIRSDPQYIAAQAEATRREAQGSATRRAAVRAAFIRYGGNLPPGFTDTYGDIDQSTMDAAKGNQNSVLAQLANNYAQSGEQFKRSLAGRGMLQSGDLAYGQDQLSRGYGQQQYDAANSFTGEVNQDENDYAGIVGGNATAMGTAIGGAEGNVYSNPAYRPVAPSYADYDAFNSSRFGKAIYKGADGVMYNSDGSQFNPPAAAPTEQNPNPNPDANGVPMSAGFYGFDQYGNWIG